MNSADLILSHLKYITLVADFISLICCNDCIGTTVL